MRLEILIQYIVIYVYLDLFQNHVLGGGHNQGGNGLQGTQPFYPYSTQGLPHPYYMTPRQAVIHRYNMLLSKFTFKLNERLNQSISSSFIAPIYKQQSSMYCRERRPLARVMYMYRTQKTSFVGEARVKQEEKACTIII